MSTSNRRGFDVVCPLGLRRGVPVGIIVKKVYNEINKTHRHLNYNFCNLTRNLARVRKSC